jgi:hypothetical protein
MTAERIDSTTSGRASAGPQRPHTFHIPVMGTGFTVDTPVRVARYGISSVLSIGDDILLEFMREQLCREFDREYIPITDRTPDHRAARITAYLNLLHSIVDRQTASLRAEPFEPGSDICRYFELLPESRLKRDYRRMMTSPGGLVRTDLQKSLRERIVAGSIDVNIMTKVDGPVMRAGIEQSSDQTVAVSALRGFANSDLCSSIILSAGMNRRLFAAFEQYSDFFADSAGVFRKKIALKVSDMRSAQIQGKMLASRGLWVSEYRVESGLNCGGHAFPTRGTLMGPILEEFRMNRETMVQRLFETLTRALKSAGRPVPASPPDIRFTAQGGIGTPEEDNFIRQYYAIDGTGWGSPFLLIPETTNVDDDLLAKLAAANFSDVHISEASPLGVPFWNLRTSSSEQARRRRIDQGQPGSSCPKGFLRYSDDYPGKPLCTASKTYQNRKIQDIAAGDYTPEQKQALTRKLLAKACICHELSGSAAIKRGFDRTMDAAICPGPGVVDYSRTATLEEMVDHIYGRFSLITNPQRPHMFMRELSLYIDYLKAEMKQSALGLVGRTGKYYAEFRDNLQSGVEYYRALAEKLKWDQREQFLADLNKLGEELKALVPEISSLIKPVSSSATIVNALRPAL